MSVSAVRNKLFGFAYRIFEIRRLIHRKNGRKFLVRKFFFETYACHFSDKNLCRLGNFYTGKLGYSVRALSDYLCVQCAVDYNRASDLIKLFGIKDITSSFLKFFFDLIINFFEYDNRLFARTDHTVVERLGMNYGVYRNL